MADMAAALQGDGPISLPKAGGYQRVDQVQVDGLALLKILKHAREEPFDSASGPLLGMVVDHVLEITNCFPFAARSNEEGDTSGEQFQMEMLRCLREVNVDHLQVGWYTATYLGEYMSERMIQPQFDFQSQIEESVALVYDPVRTAQGSLALRAFRLTPKFMDMYKDGDFSYMKVNRESLTYDKIFEEVPVIVKSSSLARMLLSELEGEAKLEGEFDRLDLSTNSYLEKNLRQLMGAVEDLTQEKQKYHMYQKDSARRAQQQQQFLHKKKQEKDQAIKAGEEVEDEDLTNHPLFKPLPAPSRLDSMLITGQINHSCAALSEYGSSNTAKLFVAQAVQDD
jgi:translation initiation factor 3 subunit H